MNRENAEQELLRLTDAWATAELRGDIPFLEDILVDDFIGIGPRGFMLTKEEWLARHKSGDLKYESFNLVQVKVRVYGDAAVLTGRQTQQGKYSGHDIQGQFRMTLVFVEQKVRWLLVSLHLSPILEAPSFTQS